MLRTWFYLGSIVSVRLLQPILGSIISIWPPATHYDIMGCDVLAFMYRNTTEVYMQFPACQLANSVFAPDGLVIVKAHLGGAAGPNNAALEITFATAGLLALILYAIGIEVYLRLTPKESERLRLLSYERQLERGMESPGSAGLVAERIGDASAWAPRCLSKSSVEIEEVEASSEVVEREVDLEKK